MGRPRCLDWEDTTAGEATSPTDFGGGCANWDETITNQALSYLRSNLAHSDQPFALIVSLANPHDVLSYPNTWDEETETGCSNYAESADFTRGIELPPTVNENLDNKPDIQDASRNIYALALGTLTTELQKRNYVNFYADLQMRVDGHIHTLLTELDTQGLTNNTIIVRLSDHGDMGLSHGGLRQKMFNAYEEAIRVPLIISNPLLFPQAVESDALASLVDVLPTLVSLAHVPNPEQWRFAGVDLTPVIEDAIQHPTQPTAAVQNAILFTFDDDRAGTGMDIPTIQNMPHHLRALIVDEPDGEWKYVRYANPEGNVTPQYELYHLRNAGGSPDDINEVNNLALNAAYADRMSQLETRLQQEESARFFPLPKSYLPIAFK